MTERRGRKRLVRDRMARTGESYTTARRRVLARVSGEPASRLPAGLVPGYETFGGGQHRDSTLLAHVLRQRGLLAPHTGEPFSEAMICGLAGGIGFLYAVFEYRGLPPLLTVVAQHHPDPWAPAVLGRLDTASTESHSTSTAAALAALRRAVDGGQPVWCTVARNRLPWHAAHAVVDEAARVLDDDRLPAAATLMRKSGEVWSWVAARAVAELPPEYVAAAERRLACLFRGESAGPVGADALPAAELDPVPLFAELADLVDAARAVEERAVALLSGVAAAYGAPDSAILDS